MKKVKLVQIVKIFLNQRTGVEAKRQKKGVVAASLNKNDEK